MQLSTSATPTPSSWAQPSSVAMTSSIPQTTVAIATSQNSATNKDNYRHIKTRYFQSLNLGKVRAQQAPTNKSVSVKKSGTTSVPIPTHTRRRSNTQPLIFYQQPVMDGDRKNSGTNSQPDYFVPFAMSVPSNVILSQSFAPSYIPRSTLESRENLFDLDEDVVGPRDNEMEDHVRDFEHSAPIEIPMFDEEVEGTTSSLSTSNFIDRETSEFEVEQRRRAAKIRNMVPIE